MPEILYPVGRMIGGNLYEARARVDDAGNPILKDGVPQTSYSIGVAIPKAGEQHWAHTAWGKLIWDEGAKAYEAMAQHPTFSWKITDGDSTIPNKKGRVPKDQTGYAGHWIIWFSQGWEIPIVDPSNNQKITTPGACVPGYYVQVYGSVVGNGTRSKPAQSPGVYQNPIAVAFIAYGEPIVGEVDISGVQFGGGALPAGASATPLSTYNPAGPVAQAGPGPVAQAGPGPVAQAGSGPGAGPVAVSGPGPVAVSGAPVYTMTPAAGGFTREQYLTANYTDEMLIAQGLVTVSGGASVVTPNYAVLGPAPQPGAPVYTMTATAGGFTREQYLAANYTDEMLIAQGLMIQS
jgi:hypothetical protein